MKRAALAVLCVFLPLLLTGQTSSSRIVPPHDPEKTEPLVLIMNPDGFAPRTLSIEKGIYFIIVNDQTGGLAGQFELERVTPGVGLGKVTDGVTGGGRFKYNNVHKLTPGTYRFSAVGKPKWVCTIEVK